MEKDCPKLIMISKNALARKGLFYILLVICIGLLISILWFSVSIIVLKFHLLFGIILMITAISYAVFLILIALNLKNDMNFHYKIEVNPNEIVLEQIDKQNSIIKHQMILIVDIIKAEYYSYSDSASLIVFSKNYELELPLWSLPHEGQDIIDYLKGLNIDIIDIQSDDS